jgi:hypothetical protein
MQYKRQAVRLEIVEQLADLAAAELEHQKEMKELNDAIMRDCEDSWYRLHDFDLSVDEFYEEEREEERKSISDDEADYFYSRYSC